MKVWICFLLCFQLLTINLAFGEGEEDFIKNTQNDILLVGAAGAGGAILGLSTLSFYENASEHLSNIWTGAAIGIIAGVLFVAYNSAQRGTEDLVSHHSPEEFSTSERSKWHLQNSQLTFQSVPFKGQIWTTSF